MKRWLIFCLLAALLMNSASAVGNAVQPQNAQQDAAPVTSYLCALEDGGVMVVRYDGVTVTAQSFDDEFSPTETVVLTPELPLFGGFYQGTDSYFLVYGQDNPEENDSTEVLRIVRYSRTWERLASASLYGANTRRPFADGTLRMVQYGDYLYLHTAHQMYRSPDGIIYQSNLTLSVRIPDMEVSDGRFAYENTETGYVSRSLDQYIALDGSTLLTADLGSAEPRAVVLTKYLLPAGKDSFTGPCRQVEVLPIGGTLGDMETGVTLGGFAVTDNAYLVAGSSVDPLSDTRSGVQNIFVAVTDKNDFSTAGTSLFWLTSYEGGSAVSSPRLVRVDSERCLLLWNENTNLHYVLLDSMGVPQTGILTAIVQAPDCEPLVRGDCILWYYMDEGSHVFCSLDLEDPLLPVQVTQPDAAVHQCVFVPELLTAASCETGGLMQYICHGCGKNYQVSLPATGHFWDDGTVTLVPTQTQGGKLTYVCTVCGAVQIKPLPPLDEPVTPSDTEPEPPPDEPATQSDTEPEPPLDEPATQSDTEPEPPLDEPVTQSDTEPEPVAPNVLLQFTDLPATSHWSYPGIVYVVEHGLFNGLSATTFAPEAAMTRAMLVTVLWRYVGSPQEDTAPFSDVKADAWYAEAVAWANQNNIVNGVGYGCFDPDGNVTREQLATILYRFARWENRDIGGSAELKGFYDAGCVSSWALDAVRWAVSVGIIGGSAENGRLMLLPDGSATRAQVATMLMRYMEAEGTE